MDSKILALAVGCVVCFAGFSYKDEISRLMNPNHKPEESAQVAHIEPEIPVIEEVVETPKPSEETNDVDLAGASNTPNRIFYNSCKKGNVKSCIDLAQLYLEGEVVERDSIKAVRILIKPCDKGDAEACKILAEIYDKGKGVAKSRNLHFEYASKACDYGDFDSCYDLGVRYYKGESRIPPKDTMKAFYIFKDGCDAGRSESCNYLAMIYNDGSHGISRNPDIAKTLLRDACSKGYQPSCENLRKIFR